MTESQYIGKKSNSKPPYIPSKALIEAVNVAIALDRPLLLKGEPGCGKTRLAKAVADELGFAYFEWPVKSTSRAQDGLYTYDTIGRLRDAQLVSTKELNHEERTELRKTFDDPASYINWGPLGKAFQKEFLEDKPRAVLLIDEIDKADIDFPNDLLYELDQNDFKVPELNTSRKKKDEIKKEIKADTKPLIFITSNDEKELPNAFLRRCLFFYIDFPKEEKLREIVSAHMADVKSREHQEYDEFTTEVVRRFCDLRDKMDNDKARSGKKVSTSELLDWVKILTKHYYEAEQKLPKPIDQELLFPSVLLKNLRDFVSYSKQLRNNE